MRKLTTILFFVCIAMTVFAWPTSDQVRKLDGSTHGWNDTLKRWEPIGTDGSGALSVDAEVNIGSITVDAFPVYSDSLGNPATATVDASNRAVVNLGSETIGLVNAITAVEAELKASPTVWEQQTITLVANTAQTITSEITGTRKNILLKAQEEKPFWVSIDGDAVISTNGTLVNDWILLDVPLAVNVSVIASEAFAISVTESGW